MVEVLRTSGSTRLNRNTERWNGGGYTHEETKKSWPLNFRKDASGGAPDDGSEIEELFFVYYWQFASRDLGKQGRFRGISHHIVPRRRHGGEANSKRISLTHIFDGVYSLSVTVIWHSLTSPDVVIAKTKPRQRYFWRINKEHLNRRL